LAELEVKRIPALDPLLNYVTVTNSDFIVFYDLSEDKTYRMTVQQFKNVISADQTKAIFAPVSDITALKNINPSDSSVWVNYGIINVATRGIYQLDRNSTLTPDNENIVAPTLGPGMWILLFKNQSNTVLAYDPGKLYDDLGGLNSYAVWALKNWEYYYATPTIESERETILGGGDGFPMENIFWREVSKADIDNIAGGGLRGTYPNPEVAIVDGGEI
jgi:hypothetical protein